MGWSGESRCQGTQAWSQALDSAQTLSEGREDPQSVCPLEGAGLHWSEYQQSWLWEVPPLLLAHRQPRAEV